jgi:NADPH:quinone reductase-like Zn-dependent oxidoreductase
MRAMVIRVVERVKELTGGKGVPVTSDTVGGDVSRCHGDRRAGGDDPRRQREHRGSRPALLYPNISRALRIHGNSNGLRDRAAAPGEILAGIARLVAAGLLRPHGAHWFPLERVAGGHRRVETSRTIGKVAILVRPA